MCFLSRSEAWFGTYGFLLLLFAECVLTWGNQSVNSLKLQDVESKPLRSSDQDVSKWRVRRLSLIVCCVGTWQWYFRPTLEYVRVRPSRPTAQFVITESIMTLKSILTKNFWQSKSCPFPFEKPGRPTSPEIETSNSITLIFTVSGSVRVGRWASLNIFVHVCSVRRVCVSSLLTL